MRLNNVTKEDLLEAEKELSIEIDDIYQSFAYNGENGGERMEGRISALENSVEKLEISVDKLEKKVDKLEYKVESLENSVGKLEISVKNLETAVGKLEVSVDNLDHKMDKLEAAFSSFKNWVSATVIGCAAITIAIVTLYTAWAIHDSNRNYELTQKALERNTEIMLRLERMEAERQK